MAEQRALRAAAVARTWLDELGDAIRGTSR